MGAVSHRPRREAAYAAGVGGVARHGHGMSSNAGGIDRGFMTVRLQFVAPLIALSAFAAGSSAQTPPPEAQPAETLFVYGPGGPLPAMKEAADSFSRRHGIAVVVTGGPTPQWLEKAKSDADVIFAGSEHMMTDFIRLMDGRIDTATVDPLYLRPSAILVRPGNPRRIERFEDLLRSGVRVLVVQGAGQTGMWEDMAGRRGDIEVVRSLRRNIGAFAPNTGEARNLWVRDSTFDAWIVYNIWQVANPTIADLVPVSPEWVVYRDSGTALTGKGRSRPHARSFVEALRSPQGAAIFARWGWITPASR